METDESSDTESLKEENTRMAEGIDRSGTSADTDTDAVAESFKAFQLDSRREDTEYEPDLFSKRRVQQETAIKTGLMTWNLPEKTVGNGINDYTLFLPPELKYDNFEMLILNTETDDIEAVNLKERVENNVTFCGSLKPNLILLKDVIPINKDGDVLDEAFKRTLYVVLYVTEEFCNHSWFLFQSHSCLKRALMSKEDRWSIIPVHTSPKNERKYELPLMLDGLRPLDYFSRTFDQDVKRLLEHKSKVILERRATLVEKRQQYMEAKHKELHKLKSLGLGTQNVFVPNLKRKEYLPDMPIKATVPNSDSQNRLSAETQEQNQVTDFTCGCSQQKTKNTAASQQQMNTEASCTKKSYLWPSEDNSSSVTTDSPCDAEISEEFSGKDIHSQQMELQRGFDYNKSCDSSPVKTTVKYSSLPEPVDVKALPEDLTLNAFNPTESNMSHKGSHINLPTGHSRSKVSDILSEEGSHPNFNDGLQRVPSNTVPINPVTSSGASPSAKDDVPRSSSSTRRLSENVTAIAGSQLHIHIHQATYVAIGEHGQINVLSRSEDADDSEDLGIGNSYSKINAAPLPSRSEDTKDSTSIQQEKNTTNQAINMLNQEKQLQNMSVRATGEGGPNREARRPVEGGPNREARRPTVGPNRTTRRPTEQEPNRTARRPTEQEPNGTARPTEEEPNGTARRPTEEEPNGTGRLPTEEESNGTARRCKKRRQRKCVIC